MLYLDCTTLLNDTCIESPLLNALEDIIIFLSLSSFVIIFSFLLNLVCRAIYDWTAGSPDELSFVTGELITIITKSTSEEGWWRGKTARGEGLFPSNYVTEQSIPGGNISTPQPPPPSQSTFTEQPPSYESAPTLPAGSPPPSFSQRPARYEPAPPDYPPPCDSAPSASPQPHKAALPARPPAYEPAPPAYPPPRDSVPPPHQPPVSSEPKQREDVVLPPSENPLPSVPEPSINPMPREHPPTVQEQRAPPRPPRLTEAPSLSRSRTMLPRSHSTLQFQRPTGDESPRLRTSTAARPRANLAASSTARPQQQGPPKLADRHRPALARSATISRSQMASALDGKPQQRRSPRPAAAVPKKEVVQTPLGVKMAEAQIDIQGNGGSSLSAAAGDYLVVFSLDSSWCDAYNLSTKSCGNVPRDCINVFENVDVPKELEVPTDGSQMLFESFLSKLNTRNEHTPRRPALPPQPHSVSQRQEMKEIEKQIEESKRMTQANNEVTKSTVGRMIGYEERTPRARQPEPLPQQNLQKFGSPTTEYLFSFSLEDASLFEKDQNGAIKGATLEYLIRMLTEKTTSKEGIMTFACTYRKYIKTSKILYLLRQRMKFPPGVYLPDKMREAKIKVFDIVKEMIADQQIDSDDVTVVNEYNELVRIGQHDSDEVIKQLFTALNSYSRAQLTDIELPKLDDGKKEITDVMEIPPADFARQLTAIESEIFQRITYQECYDFGLSKDDMQVRSPNIFKFVENFNKIGELVTSTVLRESQPAHRRKCIEFFLKVSKELLALNNYNATMEIISALGNSSISRLKKTWTDKLEQQFKPFAEYLEKNFAKLRVEMSAATPPLLPYIGIFMKDLMMIDEGNENFIGPSLLNWQKMKMQADVILKIFSIKKKKYLIPKSDSIRNFVFIYFVCLFVFVY